MYTSLVVWLYIPICNDIQEVSLGSFAMLVCSRGRRWGKRGSSFLSGIVVFLQSLHLFTE